MVNGLEPDDGIVLVDHGSRLSESNDALPRVAKLFQTTSGHPIVEPAHMELAEPSIDVAVQRCREQGAARIVVVPFFLLPGRHWQQDIPELTRLACEKRKLPYLVTAPLGEAQGVVDVLIGRMEHCLQRWQASAGDCDVCESNIPCWQRQQNVE